MDLLNFLNKNSLNSKVELISKITLISILIFLIINTVSIHAGIFNFFSDDEELQQAEKIEDNSNVSTNPNELPATVSSINNDRSGFYIEWEDGNFSDFLRQLGETLTLDFSSMDVDFFGYGNGNSKTRGNDNYTNIDAHYYHKQYAYEQESQATSHSSTEVQDIAESTNVEGYLDDQVDSDQNNAEDWRKNRQWWQRGMSPMV